MKSTTGNFPFQWIDRGGHCWLVWDKGIQTEAWALSHKEHSSALFIRSQEEPQDSCDQNLPHKCPAHLKINKCTWFRKFSHASQWLNHPLLILFLHPPVLSLAWSQFLNFFLWILLPASNIVLLYQDLARSLVPSLLNSWDWIWPCMPAEHSANKSGQAAMVGTKTTNQRVCFWEYSCLGIIEFLGIVIYNTHKIWKMLRLFILLFSSSLLLESN